MKASLAYHLLEKAATDFPDKIAIIHKDHTTTYKSLHNLARNVAEFLLESGIAPDSRIGILTDEPVHYIASYFGIQMAGGIAVGLNTQTTPRSLSYYINDCKMDGLVVDKKYVGILKKTFAEIPPIKAIISNADLKSIECPVDCLGNFNELQEKAPAGTRLPFRSSCDIAQIIYTSGTTGKPKGVMLRHLNLLTNTSSIVSYLKITKDDKIMAVLPFFYSYGNSVMLTHICQGATLVVNQNFVYPNVILEEMLEHEVTGFSGVPSTFALLLHRSNIEHFSFPSLRYITQAGAPMSPALARKLQKILPGVEIFIMYGQTEASARLSYLPPEDLLKKPDSIGIPIPGVELILMDEKGNEVAVGETGEIVARGNNIMAGYWNSPEETKKVLRPEGLRTGDLAYQDNDGYFYIVSRKSDIIKSGSHRIAPREIEDVVMEHDSIQEAAAIGVDDEMLGEAIWLFIVFKPGKECKATIIKKHCRELLPGFKVPHVICSIDSLPKTATGKIRKKDLKKLALEKISNRKAKNG